MLIYCSKSHLTTFDGDSQPLQELGHFGEFVTVRLGPCPSGRNGVSDRCKPRSLTPYEVDLLTPFNSMTSDEPYIGD